MVSTTPVHGTWFKNNIPLQDNADCRQIQEDKRFQLVVKVRAELLIEEPGRWSLLGSLRGRWRDLLHQDLQSRGNSHLQLQIVRSRRSVEQCEERDDQDGVFLILEISDERTLRDDLIIREGSSPETRKGLISEDQSVQHCLASLSPDGTDNEDELRITELPYDATGAYKVTPHIGRAPIFLQSLNPTISKAGDIVTLKCTVTATPMPTAVWFVERRRDSCSNDTLLFLPGTKIIKRFKQEGDTRSSTIRTARTRWSFPMPCLKIQAHLKSPFAISTERPIPKRIFKFSVRLPSPSLSHSLECSFLERESVFIPIPVTRVSTEEHGTARLACAVKRPDVNVDWYRGDQALFTGEQEENLKYKRIDDGLQRELIVKNVSNDDQGDYVCQADKYRVTLHLNVQGQ